MKPIVVIINGYPQSGKDTFIDLVQRYAKKNVFNISSVDPAKAIHNFIDKNFLDSNLKNAKTNYYRKFISEMKALTDKYWDLSNIFLCKTISKINRENSKHKNIFFVHIREPFNINKFIDINKYFYIIKTLFIDRPKTENEINNYCLSDKEVYFYEYDKYISNNSDIMNLRFEAEKYLDELLKGG